MRATPRDSKSVRKADCLPKLWKLKFIEAKDRADSQLQAFREKIVENDPKPEQKVRAMGHTWTWSGT